MAVLFLVHKILVDPSITQQGILMQSTNVLWSLENMATHFSITNPPIAGHILLIHE